MIYFVSDLHLSPATPGVTTLFLEFIAGPAKQAESLYLLGDLFEYWAGDDDLSDPFNARIATALRQLTDHGVKVGLIVGNRDFLLGRAFAEATGITLLDDPYILSVPTWQFVLTHGDTLCSDDLPYQAFRAQVRQPAWQQHFLAQPLPERKRQIMAVRQKSEADKKAIADSAAYLMDVSSGTTHDFLQNYGYATLIHGHTHRPAKHDHIVDGIHCERWVLADWREADSARGEVLTWDGTALHRLPIEGKNPV